MMNRILPIICMLFCIDVMAAAPTIASLLPVSASSGMTVAINGNT